MRVVVTRPAAQGQRLVCELRSLGAEAVALPLIEIAGPADPQAVRRAWAELPQVAFAMFVSANAVEQFFAARPVLSGWPAEVLAGSSGPGTTAALLAAGVQRSQVLDPGAQGPFDTDTLWERRLYARDWTGKRVLVVRGEHGRDWLAEQLRAAGARLQFLAAYRRLVPVPDDAMRGVLAAALAQPQAHCWHFSSSEAIANLAMICPSFDPSGSRALVTHPRIAVRARELGFGRVEEVGLHAQDVVRALIGAEESGGPDPHR
ncbi:MAG TPA: uroporphyrinogen-III synthase [Rubrivivax sp.]|nr:uroporphyrinogen-III synthase [Burkholderiales bacterium]HNU11938.1 uroporphyrinogen-III synthase [Rubrivivax sp.]